MTEHSVLVKTLQRSVNTHLYTRDRLSTQFGIFKVPVIIKLTFFLLTGCLQFLVSFLFFLDLNQRRFTCLCNM